jgi:hypothetical protein
MSDQHCTLWVSALLGKSKIFTCGCCKKLIVIADPSFLSLYEGHFYCVRCRKDGEYQSASQQEERALRSEDVLATS